MNGKFTIRRFIRADAAEVRDVIHRGLREVNAKDCTAERFTECCNFYTVERIIDQAETAHTYVAVSDAGRVVGTGTIAPYQGSETESILLTIYVLPEQIGNGIGSEIVRTLEKDPYFLRAKRIEIPSSVFAVDFYRKMGYQFKDGRQEPDGVFLMEKSK